MIHKITYTAAAAAAAAKSLKSCPTLCNPIDGSPPGSPVPGILQARILEWVAISFSNASMHTKSLQSCLTLCNLMDSSPPGSLVHRLFQARIVECPKRGMVTKRRKLILGTLTKSESPLFLG